MRLALRCISVLFALALVLAAPSIAAADTQTKNDDPDVGPAYWGTPDIRQVHWDVSGGNATLALTVADTDRYNLEYAVYIDTDNDAVANYWIDTYHSASSWGASLGPSSGDTCNQAPDTGGSAQTLTVTQSNNDETGTMTFPLSAIGGATTFRWAAIGIGFNMGFGEQRDYVPDQTSDPSCPDNGNLYYSSGDANLKLSKGYVFPDPPAPSVSFNTPADGATYDQYSTVTASYSCTDYGSNSLSGLNCDGRGDDGLQYASGTAIDTFNAGQHTFSVVGKDDQGQTTIVTHTYYVQPPAGGGTPPPGGDPTPPGDIGGSTGGGGGGSTGGGGGGTGGGGSTGGGGGAASHYSLLDLQTSDQVSQLDPSYVPQCDPASKFYDANLCSLVQLPGGSAVGAALRAAAQAIESAYVQKTAAQSVNLAAPVISNLAFGTTPVSVPPSLGKVTYNLYDLSGNVVAVGSGNVVAVGAGNVVGVGSGNVVGVGSGNVVAVGAGNVVAVGAGNLEPVNGAQVVAVGSGNFQLRDKLGHVVAVGAGNVVAVGSGNVVAVGAGNMQVAQGSLQYDPTGKLISDGGGSLIARDSAGFTQAVSFVQAGSQTSILSTYGGGILSTYGGGFAHGKITAAGKRKPIVLGVGTAKSNGPAVVREQIRFTKIGRRILKALAKAARKGKLRGKTLPFTSTLKYTPKGGKPIVVTRSGKARRR